MIETVLQGVFSQFLLRAIFTGVVSCGVAAIGNPEALVDADDDVEKYDDELD